MTTTELIESFFGSEIPKEWDIETDPLGNISIESVQWLMKEYAKVKCKEQKILCQELAKDCERVHDVRNAPEPEIE